MATEPQEALASDLESSCEKQPIPGGPERIKDIKDPHIQSLGKFAVEEHNKQVGSHLVFQEVISGSSQIVAGVSYILQLRALDKVMSHIYVASVFNDLDNNLHLNDFYPITRDEDN